MVEKPEQAKQPFIWGLRRSAKKIIRTGIEEVQRRVSRDELVPQARWFERSMYSFYVSIYLCEKSCVAILGGLVHIEEQARKRSEGSVC